jgi:hypothetical protein
MSRFTRSLIQGFCSARSTIGIRNSGMCSLFAEFIPLIQPKGGVMGCGPPMAIERFIRGDRPYGSITQAEFDYISSLIDYARGLGKLRSLLRREVSVEWRV